MRTQLSQWISRLLSLISGLGSSARHSELPPSSVDSSGSQKSREKYTDPRQTGRLTEHFTLSEAVKSSTARSLGLSNQPDDAELKAIIDTANRMEHVRALLKGPVLVSSWFRSPGVNAAVGGSSTSDHMSGRSVDFTCPAYGTPYDVCKAIESSGIRFDQLIYETNARGSKWVHIGFGERMRGQVMTYTPQSGYTNGIARHV